MFKPHYGTCTNCGAGDQPIVVKKGWCSRCNNSKKEERRGGSRVPERETQDIEGYTRNAYSPIRKKKLQRSRKRTGSTAMGKKMEQKSDSFKIGATPGLQGIKKEHTLVYMKAFGYTIADFIPCEITGVRCNDIHHIYARGMGGSAKESELYNRIENLMAVTREYHEEYGDKDQYYGFLIQKHFEFLEASGVPYDKNFFEKWPKNQ